ncbi:DUF5063 domain-containing protein [Sporolactobacillus sp. CPB3-1]|uniref:DUF5063 domain-containing protein n=1 Tax=Sporolactobacillus mangiferae TaxID=2940498 RepID=A0ABT0MD39_9BACL|nr:DUF5063 domain-containing protein [Sporolactobacillus mangiferae]MCL1632795.1 DUF5063 domain-containing protein [Sporolactobacillus mangiferae]
MLEIANEFYRNAKMYCDFIDIIDDSLNYKLLLEKILNIYASGVKLSKTEFDQVESINDNISYPNLNIGKNDYYWEVFDAYQLDEPIHASLTDDISDIYHDLQEGILLYNKGKTEGALGTWKFSFETHWGRHAIDATRALHSIVFRITDED